jgi:hypothetical protein
MTRDDLVASFIQSAEFRHKQEVRRGEATDFAAPPGDAPRISPLASQLATQGQIDTMLYWRWCEEIRELPAHHRKQWEYVFLLQALEETGMLRPGRRGLGFGVGREPIPSVLAARGCDVVVTDLGDAAASRRGWRETQQHSSSAEELHRPDICPLDVFRRRVQFRVCDMNAIDPELKAGEYDFVWSLCALEHLGSLENGLAFVKQSLQCLRPGGVAVHTTEYNVSSDDQTVASGSTVLYRRSDVERLAAELRASGCAIELNLHPGDRPLDRYYDVPPYKSDVHLKLQLGEFVATSLGLLIRNGAEPAGDAA